MDNCVTSVDSEIELEVFVSEATMIMSKGGFELRGWENSYDLLENETTLVLEISWNKKKDTMSINPTVLNLNKPEVVTKRVILSAAHKIFDSIGFTSPMSVLPKLLLKELWSEKIEWDVKVAKNQTKRFLNWLDDLPALNQIEIRRKLGKGDLIHTFCASGSVYATAIFARIEYENTVNVRLLSARSRIAPEKVTISRLELMAASIAARLTISVTKSLTRRVSKTMFWSDSTTVLAWIKRDMQWGTFVRNRVEKIRSLSGQDKWKYVPSDESCRSLLERL